MKKPSNTALIQEFQKYSFCKIIGESNDFNSFFVEINNHLIFMTGIHTPLNAQNAVMLANLKIPTIQALRLSNVLTLPSIYYMSNNQFEDASKEIQEFISINKQIIAKPINGLKSRDVFLDIKTLEDAKVAWDVIQNKSYKGVMFEKFAKGDVYRLLFLNGELIAALRREKAYVLGNGKDTLTELINARNHQLDLSVRYVGRIDAESKKSLLHKQGFNLDSVPDVGTKIQLEIDFSNVETVTEVTADVNPELISQIGKFCKKIELNSAGVDVISENISKAENSYVLEINKEPALDFHHCPDYGKKINVSEKIVKANIDKYI